MKLTKITLATTTALTLTMGAALAADNNTAFSEQDGDDNVFTAEQSKGAGGNDIATSADPVTQQGNRNEFEYDQHGQPEDNDILKAEQTGDDNFMRFFDEFSAKGSRANDVQQNGDDNELLIKRRGVVDNTVGTVLQTGNSNTLFIGQSKNGSAAVDRTGNEIALVEQIGSNNGIGFQASKAGIHIVQKGGNNLLTRVSMKGSDNGVGAIKITQTGNNNGRTLGEAVMEGSNGNLIDVAQTGNDNNFGVYQGTDSNSTGNTVMLTQTGMGNSIKATQKGDYNHLVANFTGDDNGVGSLDGEAGTLVSGSGGLLVQGETLQDSTGTSGGNSISYDVTGDSNLFAMAQIGGNNTINGTVGSNSNQVAVLQDGSSNSYGFTQTGGNGNIASVSQ